ncbi:MAG: SDR family oxidoreductase [Planctomycetota bacterium]
MDLGISGRVALVTASTKGLGRATAEALASEGVHLAISSRNEAEARFVASEIAQRHGVRTLGVGCDVTQRADLESLVAQVSDGLGPIDIAVPNTGGPPPGVFANLEDDQWAAGVESTLMNVVRLVRLVAPGMTERGWGRVVAITSTSAHEPISGLTISNALRPGLHGLVKDLSNDLAPMGVTVNAVAPGMHDTARLRHVAEARNPEDPEAGLNAIAQTIPVGRLGRPDDFGKAVAFLCSEPAGFMSGTALFMDGGATRAAH